MCIAIIGAMEQEVTLLAQQLGNPSPVTIAGVRFYQGELDGHAVLLTQSGIGKVAAAVATTLAIHHFGATKVINTGSAGGFNPMLQVGDLVVASELRYHDADVTAFGYERGQMAAQPAAFICDNELVAAATAASSILPELNCTTGLICSGDSFMCDPQRVAQVREWFPTMEAVEMEGAAIAQVCHQFEVPFVVIRALSDIAGSESPVSFDSFLVTAGKHSALLVMELIKRI